MRQQQAFARRRLSRSEPKHTGRIVLENEVDRRVAEPALAVEDDDGVLQIKSIHADGVGRTAPGVERYDAKSQQAAGERNKRQWVGV